MADVTPPHTVLETDRLLLRPWRAGEGGVQHELWIERDDRIPPHRRISADGHPTVAELEQRIRTSQPSTISLLAVELKATHEVVGYCGLIANTWGPADEPELAYELFRRHRGRGYATEAAQAVVDWAAASGLERLWATIRDWNTASLRVAQKLGFVASGREEPDAHWGTTVFMTRSLPSVHDVAVYVEPNVRVEHRRG